MRIAVIGSGIAGLSCAWLLARHAEVTIFERQSRVGGHTNTVKFTAPSGEEIAVDTGFIVYNLATYPNLIALFAHLNVPTQPSDMSFAVSLDNGGYEYAGDNLKTLLGHWQNALSLNHYRLIADLIKFSSDGARLCAAPVNQTLDEFLSTRRYSRPFIDNYLLPMAAAIWSAAPRHILTFPARTFGHFFVNHGLLELSARKRPQWRTVTGGAQNYIDRMMTASNPAIRLNSRIAEISGGDLQASMTMDTGETLTFDHIVTATHADEAFALLAPAARESRAALSAFSYTQNRAYLHTDPHFMPRRKSLWASWNYLRRSPAETPSVFVTYWMIRLQNIRSEQPLFVTLNPPSPPADIRIIAETTYHHPQFDAAAIAAQSRLSQFQGHDRLWFCGSYFGYGFHEDALSSGLAVAEALGAERPWQVTESSPAAANARPAGERR